MKILITQEIYLINICNSQGYTFSYMAASLGEKPLLNI